MHLRHLVALGTPATLAVAVGLAVTLDDIFTRFTGSDLDEGGTYRDVARTRRTARRPG